MKTTAKKQAGPDLDDLTFAQAAEICGYTPTWLRQLCRDGYFPRQPNGNVSLEAVIRGIERSIMGWKPPAELWPKVGDGVNR